MTDTKVLLRCARLATAFFAGIVVTFFAGYTPDSWFALKFSFPTLLLALIFIFTILAKIIKDTKPKN